MNHGHDGREEKFSHHLAQTLGHDQTAAARAILKMAERMGADPQQVYALAAVRVSERMQRLGRTLPDYADLMAETDGTESRETSVV